MQRRKKSMGKVLVTVNGGIANVQIFPKTAKIDVVLIDHDNLEREEHPDVILAAIKEVHALGKIPKNVKTMLLASLESYYQRALNEQHM